MATIYVLVDGRERDPVRRVRYVGRTVRLVAARLRSHWDRAKAGEQTHRARWMRAVQADGGDVDIEEIMRVPCLFADSAEIDYITRCRELGCDLTNTTDGGLGLLNPSRDTRAKMSASASGHKRWVGKTHTDAALAKMRAWHLGKSISVAHRLKLSMALRGSRSHLAKLTWDKVASIRHRRQEDNLSVAALASEYRVSETTIRDIVRWRTWVAAT